MKLQLSPSDARELATLAGPYSTMEDSVLRVLSAFLTKGHDPYTRRDVCAVLEAMGSPADPVNAVLPETGETGNKVINPLIRGTVAGSMGYYTQKDGAGSPPAPRAAPRSAASASVIATTPRAVSTSVLAGARVEVRTKEGVSYAPTLVLAPQPLQESFYAEDVGLRRIAVSQTSCFGLYSERVSACQSCPLARYCAASVLSTLAEIVNTLDSQTETELASALQMAEAEAERERLAAEAALRPAPPAPSLAPATPVAPTSPASSSASSSAAGLPKSMSTLTLPFSSACSHCDKKIEKGDTAVHNAGKGVLHLDCAKIVAGMSSTSPATL